MDKVKKFAVGAGIVFGAAYIAGFVAKKANTTGSAITPDSFLVKFSGPLAGGALAVAANMAGLL